VLELKDKVDASLLPEQADMPSGLSAPVGGSAEEAIKALIVLGYSRYQAGQAVKGCDTGMPVEDIVRTALRLLMK
jgi:Holliday junction DNA helicase RuvA